MKKIDSSLACYAYRGSLLKDQVRRSNCGGCGGIFVEETVKEEAVDKSRSGMLCFRDRMIYESRLDSVERKGGAPSILSRLQRDYSTRARVYLYVERLAAHARERLTIRRRRRRRRDEGVDIDRATALERRTTRRLRNATSTIDDPVRDRTSHNRNGYAANAEPQSARTILMNLFPPYLSSEDVQ